MSVPMRTSEDPDASPPLSDVAARAAIAVGWRFVALAVAGVLFLLLTSLTRWQRTFAPSQAWLEVIDERAKEPGQGPWMEVLSGVVRKMNEPPASAKFEDADDFFAAVRTTWEGMPVEAFPEEIRAEIGEHRQSKPQLKALRSKRSELLGSFDSELDSLVSELRSEAVAVKTAEKGLEASTMFPAPVADDRLEWDLRRLNEKRAALATRRQTVIDHIAQRNATEQSVNRAISTQEARTQKTEANLRRAFDAVAGSARPASPRLRYLIEPRTALRIGDEGDSLHILYVVAWYGIEGAIALLICLILLPWLLRIAGGSGDPRELRSTVTGRIKGWIEAALASTPARLLVTGVAATAIAGATIAATPHENWPTVQVFSAPVAPASDTRGEQGARGEPGRQGDAGKPGEVGRTGDPGEPGSSGEVVDSPGGLLPGSQGCFDCLEAIGAQGARIDNLGSSVHGVSAALADFAASTAQEMTTLSARSTVTLTYARQNAESTARIAASCEESQREAARIQERLTGIEKELAELKEASTGGTERLEARGGEILRLQEETLAEVKGIPPMVGDVLRLAAGPEGAIQRWLLRQDYVVTEAALAMVKRGLPDPTTGDGLVVAMALGKMLSGDREPKSASSFKKAFEEKLPPNPPPSLRQLLEQSMPLIYWACRVPD